MQKKVLNETSLSWGFLPNLSSVENDIIHFHFFNDFALLSLKKKERDKYNDFELSYHQQHSWIMDYIRDKFKLKEDKILITQTTYGSIHFFGESSLTRNHINSNSAFTVIYLVHGAGNLILEWKNPQNKECDWTIPMIPGKYVVFSANINYSFIKNESTDIRTIITWNCQIK